MKAKLVRESLNESKKYISYAQQEWDHLSQEQKLDILLQYVKDPDDAEFYSTVEDVHDLPDDIEANVVGLLEKLYNESEPEEEIEPEPEESGIPDHYPEHPANNWSWR